MVLFVLHSLLHRPGQDGSLLRADVLPLRSFIIYHYGISWLKLIFSITTFLYKF
jgi:hypothetical protein